LNQQNLLRRDPELRRVADSIFGFATEFRTDRNKRADQRAEAALPKTVRQKYGGGVVDQLLKLTHTTLDEEMPPLYQELAGRPKAMSKRLFMQGLVDKMADKLKTVGFKVSPAQVLSLRTFTFVASHHHDLGAGLTPFSITPMDTMSPQAIQARQEDAQQADIFDLSGDNTHGSLTTADANRMRNSKGFVPTEWTDARAQLWASQVLYAVLLGPAHPVTKALVSFVSLFDRIETRLQRVMEAEYGGKKAGAMLVLYAHMKLFYWLENQTNYSITEHLAPPDLVEGLARFQVTNNLDGSLLPETYQRWNSSTNGPQPPLPEGLAQQQLGLLPHRLPQQQEQRLELVTMQGAASRTISAMRSTPLTPPLRG
jgi:hypothetical protein